MALYVRLLCNVCLHPLTNTEHVLLTSLLIRACVLLALLFRFPNRTTNHFFPDSLQRFNAARQVLDSAFPAVPCLTHCCRSASDLEADSNILRQEVEKLLQALDSSHCLDSEKQRNSFVHCGKTKVFLTQSMVSYFYTRTFLYILSTALDPAFL